MAEREVCPTCERFLPIPEEQREPRERGQANHTFPTKAEADSYRELLKLARKDPRVAHLGKRVQAGPLAHAITYDWLTR